MAIPCNGKCYGVYDAHQGVAPQVAQINRHQDGEYVVRVAFMQPNGILGAWMEPTEDECFIGGSMFGTLPEAETHARLRYD